MFSYLICRVKSIEKDRSVLYYQAEDQIQCKCVPEYMLIGDPSLVIGGYVD